MFRSSLLYRKLRRIWPIPADTVPRPSVTSMSPAAFTVAGGFTVTLTGSGFWYPNSSLHAYNVSKVEVIDVTNGGWTSVAFTIVSATSITFTAPAFASGGIAAIRVTGPGGQSVFMTTTAGNVPTVSSVSPALGPDSGGTPVTITGTNFTSATGAAIGGVNITSFVVVNDTTITGVTGAHAAGSVTCSVTGPGGTGSLSSAFTYWVTPTISSVSPSLGQLAGGTAVTLTGTGFTGATSAAFGGVNLTSFVVVNDTTITGVTGTHAAGVVNATVSNPGATGTGSSVYEYWDLTVTTATGLWEDFPGTTWTGKASAGTSGSHNLTGTTPPTTGTAVNGHVPAVFNGSTQAFDTSTMLLSDLVSAGAGMIVFLMKLTSATAYDGASRDSDGIFSETNGSYLQMGYTSSGLDASLYDGVFNEVAPVAGGSGVWAMYAFWWDGTNAHASINAGAANTHGAHSVASLAGNILVGTNFNLHHLNGQMLAGVTYASDQSSTLSKIKQYFNSQYGLSL